MREYKGYLSLLISREDHSCMQFFNGSSSLCGTVAFPDLKDSMKPEKPKLHLKMLPLQWLNSF